MPYEVELVRDGDKVVEVTIRALPDAELTAIHVRTAMQAVITRLPRGTSEQASRRTPVGRNRIARYAAAVEDLEFGRLSRWPCSSPRPIKRRVV